VVQPDSKALKPTHTHSDAPLAPHSAHLLREQVLVPPEHDSRPRALWDAPVVAVVPVLRERPRKEWLLLHARVCLSVVVLLKVVVEPFHLGVHLPMRNSN
jgi:hypothetical protein